MSVNMIAKAADKKNYFVYMVSNRGVQYFLAQDGKWYRPTAVAMPGRDKPRDPFAPKPPIVKVFASHEEAEKIVSQERSENPAVKFDVYSAKEDMDVFDMLRGWNK